MKYIIPFILILFFVSCNKDIVEKPLVEEAMSAKPGATIQSLIDNSKNGVIRLRGSYYENITIPEGVTVMIIKGSLTGYVKMYGGSFYGDIVTTSGYGEAVSVMSGNNIIEGNINSYSSAIVTYAGTTTFKGNINAVIDYGVRNAGGKFFGSGYIFSKYNSALHNSGGDSYSEFTGTLESDGLFAFEMSGGNARLFNAILETNTLDNVEGSGISKYGGDTLDIDNISITCTALGAYSIEKQGVTNMGLIRVLSPCYANRPTADGLNIINRELLTIK